MNIAETNQIKFALPAKGRLKDPSIDLLKRSGYKFRTRERDLYATCTNSDIIFIFVRADDIPVLVESGVVDIGITGSDLVMEKKADTVTLLPLGFGKCRLCVAVKDTFAETGMDYFEDKNVTTSFPVLTKDFFRENKINVNCVEMNGSVEIMIALNLAEAIVDIVETGDSLKANNLKILKEIGKYEATLIGNKKFNNDPRIAQIKRRMEGVLVAGKYSLLEYNIHRNLLNEAEKITPGFESPTVSKLDQKDWLAIKVMVQKNDVVSVMDKLEALGATGIIETEISNCRL